MVRDRPVEQVVVAGECSTHRVGLLLPQARRRLDVGEQQGDRSDRQIGHVDSPPRRRASDLASSRVSDSNRRHLLYKRSALPPELTRRVRKAIPARRRAISVHATRGRRAHVERLDVTVHRDRRDHVAASASEARRGRGPSAPSTRTSGASATRELEHRRSPSASSPTHHTPARLARSSAPGCRTTKATGRYSTAPAAALATAGVSPAARWRGQHDAGCAGRLGAAHHRAEVLRVGDAVERDQERTSDRARRSSRSAAGTGAATRSPLAARRCGPAARSGRPARA